MTIFQKQIDSGLFRISEFNRIVLVFSAIFVLVACGPERVSVPVKHTEQRDTLKTDSTAIVSVVRVKVLPNDSLDDLASIIAGTIDSSKLFPQITGSKAYKSYRKHFSKRWASFDSTRISKLKGFHESELKSNLEPANRIFYPFSGPDYLYAGIFFPEAQHYVLVGLEPVGTLDALEKADTDSLGNYFSSLNRSVNALLQFSFFRTNSMEEDLNSKDLDGVMHLLFLFLKREGNRLVSARPVGIDSTGTVYYHSSFSELKDKNKTIKGLEIRYLNTKDSLKKLHYFSVNLADPALRKNNSFIVFLQGHSPYITYLKGASYLLHKPYFSKVRQSILSQSSAVVQDDSGIAFHYFLSDKRSWNYRLYGQYSKPISLFSKSWQPDLDSFYRTQKAVPLGFGIGYNFKDNNSNLMIAIP